MMDYEDSRLKEALVAKKEMQCTLNAKLVREAIIEVYSSTRKAVMAFLASNVQQYPNLTMIADIWTCKTTGRKPLGIRVYPVDNDRILISVMLGTRKFMEIEMVESKLHFYFCLRTLEDVGLSVGNFYVATSDKGPDVHNLMTNRLQYQWEWCMVRMSHAATCASCGMKGTNTSPPPGMSSLISKMNKTILEVKHAEVTGDLVKEVFSSMTGGSATTFLSCSDARFLSVTKAMRRVLHKWEVIKVWYNERAAKAARENKPPPVFPLAGEHVALVKVMSLLQPLADLKRSCQAEDPTQAEGLLNLHSICLNDLDLEKAACYYLSTPKKPFWIQPNLLTPLATATRRLLQEALDKCFLYGTVTTRRLQKHLLCLKCSKTGVLHHNPFTHQ
ncbi:unnamed protein product [Phytophthora fragariaefolia]|uniref:Unnamed protein product n=1 Tax=Phytophthora fragariaefolia TaxID=1490495 RepID=A0A9W6TV51_9STRA|nr:unnamed protein product [Phytophthora fragariaefolia]